MPSRKRNKGKERKAKKQAEQAEVTRAQARLRWQFWARGRGENINGVAIQCNHGCHITIPNDHAGHPALDLLDTFFVNWATANIGMLDNLKDTLQKQPQAWDNHNYREMLTMTLIRIGTNMLLTTNELNGPGSLAIAIAVLEEYEEVGDIDSAIYSRRSAKKLRNLHWNVSSMKRDLLKFYRKRISCSCLKAMHLEARKTLPKLGACFQCKVVTERALLMVCSRCRCHHYCSRECQVAAWDEHKHDCDLFDRVHNQQSK